MECRRDIPKARQLRRQSTDAEQLLWRFLRNRQQDGFKFRRQVPLGPYIADFACPEAGLLIELDGGQHLEQAARDAGRTASLEAGGCRVLRFWNHEVLLQIDSVLEEIQRRLRPVHPHPGPLPQAGEGE